MEQYIKIRAHDDEGNLIGTFKISIDINYTTKSIRSIKEQNKEIKLDSSLYNIPYNSTIELYNVPIVYDFDNKTPIQFYKTGDNVNIMLLEEYRYTLSFKANAKNKEFMDLLKNSNDIDVFHTLLKFDSTVLELFPKTYNGFLSFGSYVGKTFLDIYRNGQSIFQLAIEVRSRKIDYNVQYTAMIGDLSKFSQSLIYDSSSPTWLNFKRDEIRDRANYEEFMLLEYLFKDENLPSTIEYLSRNLYSALENTVEEVPTSFASNVRLDDNSHENNSIWQERTKGYVPLKVNETKYIDNIDVPENRFYKNFLESIETLINELIKKAPEGYVKDKLLVYKEQISSYLSARYFKDISYMDYVPLNSQLLQKKEGYRDILEYYLMFEFGFMLNWSEVTTEFKGNEKKLFELYEYWSYIELLDIFREMTNTNFKFEEIFYKREESFDMDLKWGLSNVFNININDKDIEMDLRYNKTFPSTSSNEFGSYSVKLRPDYSLLINIDDATYIIHFDAKYKVNTKWDYKNEDIHKMHTYKDAIRNTIGSYILYPGDTIKEKLFYEDKEIELDSVGAFPLNPGEDKINKKVLSKFILDFLERLVDYHESLIMD